MASRKARKNFTPDRKELKDLYLQEVVAVATLTSKVRNHKRFPAHRMIKDVVIDGDIHFDHLWVVMPNHHDVKPEQRFMFRGVVFQYSTNFSISRVEVVGEIECSNPSSETLPALQTGIAL